MRTDVDTTTPHDAELWCRNHEPHPLPNTPTRDDLGPDDAAMFAADARRAEEERLRLGLTPTQMLERAMGRLVAAVEAERRAS